MKMLMVSLAFFATVASFADDTSQKIICHDDQRLNKGPLREIILTTDGDNNYFVQSSFVASLNSPDIVIDKWANGLACKIDEKATLAYCANPTGDSTVQIRDRREVYYDSLDDEAKKKTRKSIDISLMENGVEKKTISFASTDCESFGASA